MAYSSRMSERGPVSVPLQSGATAWQARVAVAARLVPGILVLTYMVWFTSRVLRSVTSGPGSSTPGWLAILVLLFVGAIGIVLVLSSLAMREVARDAAPSDLLVTTDGFRVAGGVHDGLAASWRDLLEIKLIRRPAPQVDGSWRFVREVYAGKKYSETELLELRVVAKESGGTTIAIALDPAEQRALASVAALMADAMREAHGGELAPGAISANLAPPPRDEPALGPSVFTCSSCGAAVAPEPDDEVVCPKCQARVPVPEPVREKVRAAYALPTLRAKGQAALRRMMEAPGAATTGALVTALGWGMLLLWPLAFAGVWFAAWGALAVLDVVALGAVMAATVIAVLLIDAIVRPLLVVRHAHPVTVIEYAARSAAYEGGPLRCRTCDAGLPARFDGRLARCAACSSDNVLALDLSRELPVLRRQAAALDSDIASWRRAHGRAWLVALAAAVGLAGLGGFAVWRVHHDPLLADQEAACARGEGHACVQLALLYRNKGRPDLGFAVLERSCDPESRAPGPLSACTSLGLMLSDTLFEHDPRWPARDFVRAETLLMGACGHGDKLACDAHENLCRSRRAPPACNPR
jgi:hypothetical protein